MVGVFNNFIIIVVFCFVVDVDGRFWVVSSFGNDVYVFDFGSCLSGLCFDKFFDFFGVFFMIEG